MIALGNEVTFAVKTPSGLTETRSITNKVMQGDLMAPLPSSNFVDINFAKPAIKLDSKHYENIKTQINKSFRNVNKTFSTLNERPLENYTFQAAKLMRN